MNPLDVKKRLYSEMGDAADEMELDDLRQRYGPKPAVSPVPEMAKPPAELSDEELEPLLTISIAAGKPAGGEPDEDDEMQHEMA